MKKNKLTQAMILLLIAASILPSCESAAENKPVETNAPASSTAEAVTETETAEISDLDRAIAALPQVDYDGYEFKIMDRSTEYSPVWATFDVFAEKENGEPINDAVYQRNRTVEEALNVKITELGVASPYSDMMRLISAADDSVDLFTDAVVALSWMASSNMLYNMNSIAELKLDKPWWDQQMRKNMNILDKLYMMTGDIAVMDNEGTWCMMFNKQMIKDFDFDDPYQTVRDGKWTLDKMHGMMKAVAGDVNGDSVMDVNDRWGFVSESFNVYGLWCGADNMIGGLDASGTPVITMYSDHAVSAYDKVMSMQFDESITGIVGKGPFLDYSYLGTCFGDGNALFIYGAMALITDFRVTDTDFGILPAPKFDEQQENYRSTFAAFNMTAYGIPNTAADPARTGTIMEAMAEISQYTLTPAYYDITLKGKSVRDSESEDMIDLILNTRAYDIGQIFQWGGSFAVFDQATASKIGTFSSQYQKIEKAMQTDIEKYLKNIAAND